MSGNFETEYAKIEAEYYSLPKDSLLDELSERDATLIIFGAGTVGCEFAANLGDLSNKLTAFCDNHKVGINERFGVPIISPAQLADYPDAIIVVAVNEPYNEVLYTQLVDSGIKKSSIYRRYSGYELYSIEAFRLHLDGYKWAYEFFQDEKSKRIILDRIRGYLFFHEMPHSPLEEQYFDRDAIQFTEGEVFVDGGCYTGDTALAFIQRMNGNYSYIYGFEPDPDNFDKTRRNLAAYKNIELINKGLYSKPGTLSFSSRSSSSRIDAAGTGVISLTSLDGVFCKGARLPTFIKLDIEGAEKEALIGAENVIKETRPKLAVCVYHKPEDIYELTRIIHKYGGYAFTLRHYTKGAAETVLYAIPKAL